MSIFIISMILISMLASLAAWYNTHLILREFNAVKQKLNILEETKGPFIKNDLDT